jgi:hypothetical protein
MRWLGAPFRIPRLVFDFRALRGRLGQPSLPGLAAVPSPRISARTRSARAVPLRRARSRASKPASAHFRADVERPPAPGPFPWAPSRPPPR